VEGAGSGVGEIGIERVAGGVDVALRIESDGGGVACAGVGIADDVFED